MTAVAEKQAAPAKFGDPDVTATGERRASVELRGLKTLWFNTGTLCNLTCVNCYIESSPRNDRLVYLTAGEVAEYLDELDAWPETEEIGFTGGEPFMNPDLPAMLEDSLARGYRVLVLTNAMRPMMKQADALLRIRERYGERLTLRISIDHYDKALHEEERGENTWAKTIDGMKWLADNGFNVDVAGRTRWGEAEAELRAGYRRLFAELGVAIDADDPAALVLFPEMDPEAEVPEITTACWGKLGKSPDEIMCASSRMVVKRKGAARPAVLACTLLAYDKAFEVGERLADMRRTVKLNHQHCAKFCVLGGASCSAK
ncbi:radical SAM protein [Ferruginivarius sediminum]|uniref:Radical SAM protein n=1 Tax=Ferruginivarius sediminum TaxID=2661937 RepID=A0A369TDD7_9PROT|nr:radical SAM protein [Ferruginivarius sediminum]RDD63300.1 radical SAM protein [Ferruginivarius sediminum]